MVFENGDYVSIYLHIVLEGKPLEIGAAVRKPRGTNEWRVRGRVRVVRDDLVGPESRDTKWWFESPAFSTEEEARAAWWEHLAGFVENSNLTIREQHEIVLGSADERAIFERLMREDFIRPVEPLESTDEEREYVLPSKPAVLN